MKKVEIYDQFSAVYSNEETNQLTTLSLMPGETIKSTLTLVHPSSGYVTIEGVNLTELDARDLVINLYESSKLLGSGYTDKIIDIENNYAELRIDFSDGRILNRVIYTVNENN